MTNLMHGFWGRWVVALAVALVLLLGERAGGFGGVRGASEWLLNPVSMVVFRVGEVVGLPVSAVRFWFRGAERVVDLENRLAELLAERADVARLEAENEAMRKLLGAGLSQDYQFIPARVAGGGMGRLVVLVGEVDGVAVGDLVVSQSGALVGRVDKVSARTAWAERLTAAGMRVPVRVLGMTTAGILLGKGGEVVVENVEQHDSLAAGDILVTSGIDELFLPDLVVGRVVQVFGDQADVYKTVRVELATTTDEEIVFILERD